MPSDSSGTGYLTQGLKPGDVIAGKYRVEKVLGTGGMGVVLCAYHLQLEERVAIKLLLPDVLGIPEAVARFSREARAAVKIKSEHVARVIDVGTAETGAPYMVMEYLNGSDLSDWLKRKSVLPTKQAVEFLLQTCEAIAEAHSLGIVHRDLKPANLFCIVRPDGSHSIKVLDFGISKLTGSQSGDSALAMTRTSTMMGTPFYMSPEQLRSSRDVDGRTDIWALGAILYELLTGRVPFQGETIPELCVQILQADTPSLRVALPDAPALERVIGKCLEKDREQRYASVSELATALAPFGPTRARLSVERIHGIARGLAAPESELPPPSSSPQLEAEPQPRTAVAWGTTGTGAQKRKPWYAAFVFLVAVTIGLGFAWVWRSRFAASHDAPLNSAAQALSSQLIASATTANATPAMAEPKRAAPEREAAAAVAPAAAVSVQTDPTASISNAAPSASPKPNPIKATEKRTSPRDTRGIKAAPAPAEPANKAQGTPKPNCDPPYTLDDQGRKHFRAECF